MCVHPGASRGRAPRRTAWVAEPLITEEGIADLESRVGLYYRSGPYRLEVTSDDIRNNARMNGDWNPLYVDPDYGIGTRFGTHVAPPTYVDLIKHYTATAIGGLPGVHAFHAGNDIEFFQAVRAGDTIGPTFRPWRVERKRGRFAGEMVAMDVEIAYRNQFDELVAVAHGNVLRVVRAEARERGKYADVKPEPYQPEELERIWDAYDREEIRGSTPRYWEDVAVGELVGPIVRGPLRIVEISFRNWHGGGRLTGAGGMTYGGHYFQFQEYLQRPGYAETDVETGVSDHPHRGHWEDSFARKIGVPGAYDIAVQRTAWHATLMTNWVGDEGWLRRVWCEFRLFNVEGDTTWITGKVIRKWIEGRQHLVEVELTAQNQRGESTTPGGAWVVLPSRHPGGYVPGVTGRSR
jgi:acyl dehydratase